MLSEVETFNKESKKIRAEAEAHLRKKARCRRQESSMTIVLSGCDKLWKKKSTEARRTARRKKEDEEEEDHHNDDEEEDHHSAEEECKEEKQEETIKYRRHQYRENPQMELSGEDMEIVMECDHCGPDMIEMVRQDCELEDCCGKGWVREDYKLCIIGNDVVSLFPSLDSKDTGKIDRRCQDLQ